jgi:hypothetical protein
MVGISTLRPGLLIALSTALRGNVSYATAEIEADHLNEDGSRQAAWETRRTVADAAEHERGIKARSKARSLITAVCKASAFGLLCPEDDSEKLSAAIAEAREIAGEFNRDARLSQLAVNVLVGRIAPDDVEAVRAINSEIRDLMSAMESGLRKLDVGAVREAANKAKALSSMLSEAASERAQKAVEAARKAARQISKAGETAAIAVDEATLKVLRESRFYFLEVEGDAAEVQAPEAQAKGGLDLEVTADEDETVSVPAMTVPVVGAFQLELE